VTFVPEDHAVSGFTCGELALDRWLKESAEHAARIRTATTFVWARKGQVVAYYCLSAHSLSCAELPTNLGRGSPDPVPAFMLGKLALHSSYHGRGYGSLLLLDALARLVGSAQTGPSARFVVVDAIDRGAMDFYRHHGFQPIPNNGLRLVRKMSDIAKSVGDGLTEPLLDLDSHPSSDPATPVRGGDRDGHAPGQG
jgi:predicted N-acetyltransferase YhbS